MPERISSQTSNIDHISEYESLERNAREQADLRIRFAEAVSKKTGTSLAKCLNDFTDLRRRLMGADPEEKDALEAHIKRWEEFTNVIANLRDHESRLDKVVERFKETTEHIDHREATYWPFSYDYINDQGEPHVRTHFGSLMPEQNVSEGPGLLSQKRYEEQRAKLREMFLEIREKHPDATKVRGRSWLYNVEAYRRMYPKVYGDSRTIAKGGYHGGSRWGQFKRSDGSVNPELREVFLKNLENLDPENIDAAFPLQTWQVEAPVKEFFKEYGIE